MGVGIYLLAKLTENERIELSHGIWSSSSSLFHIYILILRGLSLVLLFIQTLLNSFEMKLTRDKKRIDTCGGIEISFSYFDTANGGDGEDRGR